MKFCIVVVLLVTAVVNIAQAGTATNVEERIVQKKHIPYQVSLRMQNVHICSGVIIAPKWILSSARCVKSFSGSDLRVIYGARKRDGSYHSKEIDLVIANPQYDSANYENDIAMLSTKSKMEYEKNIVEEISLEAGPTINGQVMISGWGVQKVFLFDKYIITFESSVC